jgi:hypothetical protein
MFLLAVAIVAALSLAVVGVASMRSGEFHIERSLQTSAPAAKVFAVMADFNRFGEWSPWAKLDPALKTTITGEPATVGSTYAWEGNADVGSGKMTMIEVAPERIVVKLDFLRPFPSSSKITWTIKGTSDGATVGWAMDGVNETLMPKIFSLIADMDSLIGSDFEAGLTNLKGLVEKG